MKINYYYLSLIVFLFAYNTQAQTITQTYTTADIPTSFNAFSPTCNGPLTTLTLALPTGGPWEVTGFDVEYDMTAANVAYMSEQRSRIYFQNASTQEPMDYVGIGTGGTFSYNRSGIDIANAYYAGGTNLIFEMRAWRSWGSAAPNDGCGTYYNKVDNNTWTITVDYQLAPTCIPPQDIILTDLDDTEAEVSWTELGTTTDWVIEYGPEGFVQGAGTVVNTTTNPHLITGLIELTDYDVYVRSDCGGGDFSAWSGPLNFQTTADCSNYTLEITNTTDGSVVCKGSAMLSAQSSGTGSDIYWYDASFGGNLLGTGTTFISPIITTTTSYWAAEVLTSGATYSGQAKLAPTGSAATSAFTYGLLFTATQNFTLVDVEVFSAGAGGSMVVELQTASGTVLETTTVSVPGGGSTASPVPFTVPLNYVIAPGDYRLVAVSGPNMIRDLSPNAFPFPLGTAGQVTAGYISGTSQTYYYFYNWTVSQGDVLCESPRVAVNATVTQDGDEIVGPLPYVHTESTSTYGNTFTGSAGSSCGTTQNYLNGNDVVYQYSPVSDITVNINLSDITGFYAGVFVYESCGDIGDSCIAGAVNGASDGNFGIADLNLTGGQDYYIVISSWLNPDIDYTLTISESFCPQPSNLQVSNVTINSADFQWDASSNEQNGYEWAVMAQGQNPDSHIPLFTNQTATGITSVIVTGLNSNVSYAFFVRTDCGVTDGMSGWTGPMNFQTPITGATCSAAIEVTSLPYNHTDNTSNYGDNYNGSPGASGCGSTTSYLNGDDVVYHFSPSQDMTITISLSSLSGSYAGVFVYESCANIGVACYAGIVNGFSSDDFGIEDLFVVGGNDYYIVISTWAAPQTVGYTLDITRILCGAPSNLQMNNLSMNSVEFSWTSLADATDGYEWVVVNQGGNPDTATPVQSGTNISTDTDVLITGLTTGNNYAFYVRSNCGVTNGVSEWAGPINFLVPTLGSNCLDPLEVTALPYSHTGNTATYGDNYNGSPGAGCGSTLGYLNGDDVVYHFVPDEDMLVDIELSNLLGNYAGMFVYESCAAIGNTCSAGAVNGFGAANLLVNDFSVLQGQSYYIVISTWAAPQSVGYTLNITKVCTEFPNTPTTNNPNQELCIGSTLEDIQINETGVWWYSSATGGEPMPENTQLTNGVTYYAAMVVDACESASRLEVTVQLLDVSPMPQAYTNQSFLEGETLVDLDVTGDNLNWYADANGTTSLPLSTEMVDQTTYYVAQETPGFCQSPLLGITVHKTLTVNEEALLSLKYYPNPVDNILNVSHSQIIDRIEVYNLLGQKLADNKGVSNTMSLDLSNLASGTYLLKVTVGEGIAAVRIIKE